MITNPETVSLKYFMYYTRRCNIDFKPSRHGRSHYSSNYKIRERSTYEGYYKNNEYCEILFE